MEKRLNETKNICILMAIIACQFFDNYYIAIYIGLIVLILKKRDLRFKLNIECFLLAVFSIIMCYIYVYNSSVSVSMIALRGIAPWVCYIYGQRYIKNSYQEEKELENNVKKILIYMITAAAIYQVLCLIYKYTHFNIYINKMLAISSESMKNRYVLNVWNGELFQPTNFNSQILIGFAICPVFIINKEEKRIKIWSYFIITIGLISCFLTQSRSNILYLVIAFGVNLIIKFTSNRGKFIYNKNSIIKILFLLSLGIIMIFLFGKDIYSYIVNTDLVQRASSIDITNDGRWERMKAVIDNIYLYPWGNMPVTYAHNLFLDTFRETGILTSLILILYYIYIYIRVFRLCIKNKISLELKRIILSIYIIVFIGFMIEPVIQGRVNVFLQFCFINGIVQALAHSTVGLGKNNTSENKEYELL